MLRAMQVARDALGHARCVLPFGRAAASRPGALIASALAPA
jgi:hypothetical protein